MASRWSAPLLGVLALFAAAAGAEPVAVGSRVGRLQLEDQHGGAAVVDETTRILVLSRDMDGGNVVKTALADTPQSALDDRHVAYVADISGMPALVSRLMAVPRMRSRPYRVFLDRDGTVTRDLAPAENVATVLFLDASSVTRKEEARDGATLRRLVGLDP